MDDSGKVVQGVNWAKLARMSSASCVTASKALTSTGHELTALGAAAHARTVASSRSGSWSTRATGASPRLSRTASSRPMSPPRTGDHRSRTLLGARLRRVWVSAGTPRPGPLPRKSYAPRLPRLPDASPRRQTSGAVTARRRRSPHRWASRAVHRCACGRVSVPIFSLPTTVRRGAYEQHGTVTLVFMLRYEFVSQCLSTRTTIRCLSQMKEGCGATSSERELC